MVATVGPGLIGSTPTFLPPMVLKYQLQSSLTNITINILLATTSRSLYEFALLLLRLRLHGPFLSGFSVLLSISFTYLRFFGLLTIALGRTYKQQKRQLEKQPITRSSIHARRLHPKMSSSTGLTKLYRQCLIVTLLIFLLFSIVVRF